MLANEHTVRAIRNLMSSKGYVEIPSHGVSMFPLIRTGNICRFEPFTESGLRIGDILLYVSDKGVLVGHRYYRQMADGRETLYICKGDSQDYDDPPLRREQLIGKLVLIRKKRLELRVDGVLLAGWSRMMVRLPLLSTGIHWYLRAARKLRGMKAVT
jgi:signal peptidase I